MPDPITIRPVRSQKDRHALTLFPWKIYQDDPLWVPHLIPDRMNVIDPQKGTFFKRGAAEFWFAKRNGDIVGTICAAEDTFSMERNGKRDCVIGFFDFLEDFQVFSRLVETAIEWGRNRKLTHLFGPFNLDYENAYGVLIEGRDRPPVAMCGHSPEYYQQFYERYGFLKARADNLAFAFDMTESNATRRLERLAQRIKRSGKVRIRNANFDDWENEINSIHRVIEESLYAIYPDRIPWHYDQLVATLMPFKDIADPELIILAETDQEVIGWLPGIANLNETFIKVNGLKHPWNYLQLLWHMRRQTECMAVKAVGVLPEYWNTGVAVAMFDELFRRGYNKGYKWADLSITAEDNPQTPKLAAAIGAKLYKRWRTYRLPIL